MPNSYTTIIPWLSSSTINVAIITAYAYKKTDGPGESAVFSTQLRPSKPMRTQTYAFNRRHPSTSHGGPSPHLLPGDYHRPFADINDTSARQYLDEITPSYIHPIRPSESITILEKIVILRNAVARTEELCRYYKGALQQLETLSKKVQDHNL